MYIQGRGRKMGKRFVVMAASVLASILSTGMAEASAPARPPIDMRVVAGSRTATFALG